MSPRPDTLWTDQHVAQLCSARAKDVSFDKIARELHCSRSAAIGKFDRLKRDGYAPALAVKPQLRVTLRYLVADWMAENGGTVAACSRAIGHDFESVKTAWGRIRRGLGRQAI